MNWTKKSSVLFLSIGAIVLLFIFVAATYQYVHATTIQPQMIYVTRTPSPEKLKAIIEASKERISNMSNSELNTKLKEVLEWSNDHVITEEDTKSGRAA